MGWRCWESWKAPVGRSIGAVLPPARAAECQGAASPWDRCLQGPNRQQELPWGQPLTFLELSETLQQGHVLLHDPSRQQPGGASEGVPGQDLPCLVLPWWWHQGFGKLMD